MSFERHRARREHAAARGLAHLLGPAVVRAHHRGLQLGIDAVDPQVVAGPVEHHQVDALAPHALRDARAVEPPLHDVAVLGDHRLGGPAHRLLLVAVEGRGALRVAAVDGRGAEPVHARERLAPADAVAVARVEEALPQVARLHHVRVGVEYLESALHALFPRVLEPVGQLDRRIG
jgi:hypothetical protein